MICGVDEAGKGPVMGPMVVAAVSIENAKMIEGLGFKDSKLLTLRRRKSLFELIKTNYRYAIEIIEPEVIDEYRKNNKLNLLNRKAFEKVIIKLNPNILGFHAERITSCYSLMKRKLDLYSKLLSLQKQNRKNQQMQLL